MTRGERRFLEAVAKLDALYARLPTIECKGKCAMACGPIILTELEGTRLRTMDQHRRNPSTHNDLTCVYLTKSKRCGVYAFRPLICRAYGLVRMMSCPFGCVPSQWMKDTEFLQVAQEVEKIGGRLCMTGAGGARELGDTFLRIVPQIPEAEIEAHSERVRAARALLGGYVVGAPKGAQGFTNIDRPREYFQFAPKRSEDGR